MARLFAHNKNKYKRNGVAATVSQKTKEGKKAIGFALFVLIGIVGFLYISQITSVSTKGYEISKYEKKLEELKKENQNLQIRLAELNSIYNLEKESLKFSKIDSKDISYIVSTSDVVAIDR